MLNTFSKNIKSIKEKASHMLKELVRNVVCL